jgi:hypothetical protein
MPRLIYRVCHKEQTDSFHAKDVSGFKPSTESAGIPQLTNRPCLPFTGKPGLLHHFKDRIAKGGSIIEVDLDALPAQDYGEWSTGDIHVSAEAFIAHGRELAPTEIAAAMTPPATSTSPARRSFEKAGGNRRHPTKPKWLSA